VNVPSVEFPVMNRVKPGVPYASYLLHRIDGDACALLGCTDAVCNELMPQGGPALDESKRLTIRAWIAQGAVSDLPDAGTSGDAGSPSEAGPADASVSDTGADASDANSSDATSDAGDASSADASGD
jgi:hypothetical protein